MNDIMQPLDAQNPKGLLIKPIGEKDFVFGQNSPLLVGEVEPSGDWTQFMSLLEKQLLYNLETLNCTAFAYTNCVENQINRQIITKRIRMDFLQFLQNNSYLDDNGLVNFSERALGSMAGTGVNIANGTPGNSLQQVAETARKNGLVPNKLWAWNGENTYSEYYKTVPDNLKAIAKKLLTYIDLPYQWTNDMFSSIKRCPLYSALVTCSPWFSDKPIPWCNAQPDASNHAIVTVKAVNPDINKKIQDSYEPYVKELELNYVIPYNMEVIVTMLPQTIPPITGYKTANNPTVYIKLETGVYIPVASWDAFVKLGGSSNNIKIVDATAITPVVKTVFLEK